MGGAVRCWGENLYGQLGQLNTLTGAEPQSLINVNLGGAGVAQAVAGESHTCVLLTGNGMDGQVYCWGSNQFGQLGYDPNPATGVVGLGDSTDAPVTSQGPVAVGGPVKQLAAGSFHTCALLETGKVRCFGLSERGFLGYANLGMGFNAPPGDLDVSLGENAVRIAAGNAHTCALLESWNVRCWGVNQRGRLGYGVPEIDLAAVGDDETPDASPGYR